MPGKCRAQFVPQMVNSLTKLGMAQGGSNLENRSLAIDLCGVMVLWEERRIKELQSGATQVCSLTKSVPNALAPSLMQFERNFSFMSSVVGRTLHVLLWACSY